MFQPMMKRAPTICRPIWRPLPATAPPGFVSPKAAQPFLVAQSPGRCGSVRGAVRDARDGLTGADAADNGAYKMRVEDV